MTPAKHSCTRDALLECTSLSFGQGFIEPIELRIRCRCANVVRTGKNGQRRHLQCRELLAARHNRRSRCRQGRRLAAFALGQRERLASDGWWARRWGSQAGKVLLELTWDVEGVSISSFEINQSRDPLSMRHAEETHLLAGIGVPNQHRILDLQRIQHRLDVLAESRDIVA